MILYFCPDVTLRSAGVRILYRHVQILQEHNISAAIVHQHAGFQMPDMPQVPIRYLDQPAWGSNGDILVVSECAPELMAGTKTYPIRRIAIALNWRFIYQEIHQRLDHSKQPCSDYRDFAVERVITHSPFIADYVAWAMRIPCHVFSWGIRPDYYYFDPVEKRKQIAYMKRKEYTMPELLRLLYSRNPQFLEKIAWTGLDGLTEAEYATQIRRSSLFLNLSEAEGLPCSLLEAMRAGTLVAGYNSVGGQRELIGSGDRQNCLLAENLDYPALARLLEPMLEHLISGDMSPWKAIQQNALAAASAYTLEVEEASVVALWREILAKKG